jgi:hypothetical protein
MFCAKVLPLGKVELQDALVVLTETAACCRIPDDEPFTLDMTILRRLPHVIAWGEQHCPVGATTSASPAWEADLRLCDMYRYLSSAYRQMHQTAKNTTAAAAPYFATQTLLYLGKVVDRLGATVLPDPSTSSSKVSTKADELTAAGTAPTATTPTTPTTTTAATLTPSPPEAAALEAWNTRHQRLQEAYRSLAILQLLLLPPLTGNVIDHPQVRTYN